MNNLRIQHAKPLTPLTQRVLAEQLKIIILQIPQTVAASAAIAVIGALVFWNNVAHSKLLVVIFLVIFALIWLLTFYWRYRRDNSAVADVQQWELGLTLRLVVIGCSWGVYSLAVFVPNSIASQVFDVALMYGLTSGEMVLTAPRYRIFVALAVPTLLPVILRSFFEGTVASLGMGLAGLVGLAYNLFAGLNSYRATEDLIQTRFENMDLVRELEKQKETAERARAQAEHARGQAEAANVSKSRFLAAASHDLRQPVHALGLFVSAAKQSTTEAERRLINERIEEAVGSLAALFDSLLDVSRLDAGLLQPQIRDVALVPILQKLATEYAPEADEKKLQFRMHCADLAIRTDPLLFERIIRNFVTNALRYTNSGGILVACRKRGAFARVEVWDTGIGIAPEKQVQVFEEFYQIGNPERDRRNGVGLGLAIVKRVAALLQHSIHVASRVGQGSRFSIDVPIGAVSGAESGQSAWLALDDETVLFGAVILVIDDEADILTALELLLKQWGCSVIAAESAAQASEKLHVEELVPDLILADYRLRNNETGIDAVRTLRLTFGQGIPALLVTGDTAAERLRDAAVSGLEVLHKPLNAEQLRQTLIRILA